jgi:signal transduction histidine kinase
MKLTAKYTFLLLVGIIAILLVDGYATVRREADLFERDMYADAKLLGRVMQSVVKDAWETQGKAYALRLVADANRADHPMRIRWVSLDAPPGDPTRPRAGPEQLAKVASGQENAFKGGDEAGEECLYTYVPVAVEPERRGAIEVCESLSAANLYVRGTVRKQLVLVGAIAVVSAIGVSVLGVVLVGRPLKALTDKTRRVGIGDLSEPLGLRGHDEFAELAMALNEMCEGLASARQRVRAETEARIGALEQLRHADRLATVGRLAAGVAHELGTPLNVIMGRAGMIAQGRVPPGEIGSYADIIRNQTERMTTTIRQLLSFARPRTPESAPADLREIVRQTLDLMEPLARGKRASLSLVGEEAAATARVDAAQIQHVLTNLIDNAIASVTTQGRIEVGVSAERVRPPEGVDSEEGDYFRVDVRDDGGGIPAENVQHVFEPFFTTKDVGHGTGLGLSIAYRIVRDHGGWIRVESTLGEGSCFSVYLPKGA